MPGKIVQKMVTVSQFRVEYQCECGLSGNRIVFGGEVQKICPACHTLYQLRVMIGKVKQSKHTP